MARKDSLGTEGSSKVDEQPPPSPSMSSTPASEPKPEDPGKEIAADVKIESEQGKLATVASVGSNDESDPTDESAEGDADADRDERKRARVARNRRAYEIRQKPDPTDDEKSWLKEYEATPAKRGRPAKAPEPETKPEAKAEAEAAKPTTPKPGAPPPVLEQPATRARGKVKSPPPRVHDDQTWRDKYGVSSSGRELVCTTIGDGIWRTLCAMEAQLKLAGIQPWTEIATAQVRGLFVCAVDDLLPERVTATPAILATVKMSAITTQRMLRRKEIAKALETQSKAPSLRSIPRQPDPPTPPQPPESPATIVTPRREGGGDNIDAVSKALLGQSGFPRED